jgi:hypothetical protein
VGRGRRHPRDAHWQAPTPSSSSSLSLQVLDVP